MLSYSPQKSKSFLKFSANFFAAGREVPKFLRPGVELGRCRAAEGSRFAKRAAGLRKKARPEAVRAALRPGGKRK